MVQMDPKNQIGMKGHNLWQIQSNENFPLTFFRLARQGASDNEVALDIGSIAAAGERCIDKVVMVQVI